MDAAEVEPLHFITPSAEFIIFSWRLSQLCGSRSHLITTYKTFGLLSHAEFYY